MNTEILNTEHLNIEILNISPAFSIWFLEPMVEHNKSLSHSDTSMFDVQKGSVFKNVLCSTARQMPHNKMTQMTIEMATTIPSKG